jgi:hypothetical protein
LHYLLAQYRVALILYKTGNNIMFGKARLITIGMTLVAIVLIKKAAPLSIKKHF